MMWLSLQQPRYQGLRSEMQVSDLEALRLFREAAAGRYTLEASIETPHNALVFMAIYWKYQNHDSDQEATQVEYTYRWDICERVYLTLLTARMWRHVLGELHPKRGWKLEHIAAGSGPLLTTVGKRRLYRMLKRLRDEMGADQTTYPWWVTYDIGVQYYRDWLNRQLHMGIRVYAEKYR